MYGTFIEAFWEHYTKNVIINGIQVMGDEKEETVDESTEIYTETKGKSTEDENVLGNKQGVLYFCAGAALFAVLNCLDPKYNDNARTVLISGLCCLNKGEARKQDLPTGVVDDRERVANRLVRPTAEFFAIIKELEASL